MKKSHLIGAVCACLAIVSLNVNAVLLKSIVTVTGQNSSSQFDFQPWVAVNDTSLIAASTSFDINGLMNDGIQGTMTYAVDATAQSDYGSLRASYSTTVTNTFFNSANAPYDPNTGTGVPTVLSGQSNASFKDSIVVTGGTGLSEIRLLIGMEGFLEQSSSSYPFDVGYAALWQQRPTGGTSIIQGSRVNTNPGGAYNQAVLTNSYFLSNGVADVDLVLQVLNSWLLQYIAQGENVMSTIDFSNTAQIIGIEGFDSFGNSVQITSAIGDSGTNYLLSAVPVPAAIWLFGTGLLGLIGISRRKRTNELPRINNKILAE